MGSSISTPTFQALAGNIKNADGAAIYSLGAWDLRNASGTTTFAVSSAGAVTVGPAVSGAIQHVVNGSMVKLVRNDGGVSKHFLKWLNSAAASATNNYWGLQPDGTTFNFYSSPDDSTYTALGSFTNAGAWTFPVSVSVTGTADVSGTTAALRTDGGCYVAKIMSAGTVTDRTPFPKDLQTAVDAVNSMEKLPEGEYDENDKEKQLDHSKLHEYVKSGDYRDMSASVSCLVLVCQDLLKRLQSAEEKLAALEGRQ
jgi:hypothetical protein